jgi:hypothetical protein
VDEPAGYVSCVLKKISISSVIESQFDITFVAFLFRFPIPEINNCLLFLPFISTLGIVPDVTVSKLSDDTKYVI